MRSHRRASRGAIPLIVLLVPAWVDLSRRAEASDAELDRVVFGSLEAGTSSFNTSGFKIALKESGPALIVSLGGGARRERIGTVDGGTAEIGRTVATASGVLGYQWYREEGVVGLFAGPEATLTIVSDGDNFVRRTVRTGLRVQAEAWLRPSEATLFQGSLVAGTARTSVWARAAGGFRLKETYLGPEIGLYADATGYRKWFFGLHVTDLAIAGLHLRLSAGGQVTPERQLGPYLGLATWREW